MIMELVNPSDAVTFEGDDVRIAGVACLILGNGWYALHDAKGNTVVPMMMFGHHEEWLKEQGIEDLGAFVEQNANDIAGFLDTCAYGHVEDREAFNEAIKRMTTDKAEEHRQWWNERNRSSINNIGAGCRDLAKALRKKAKKLPSCAPIVVGA